MKQQVILASLEVSSYRQDLKVKSGSDFEIYRILKQELDLDSWIPWIYENDIKLQFGYWLKPDTYVAVYRLWALMTPEQATIWKLTWGHQSKVIA